LNWQNFGGVDELYRRRIHHEGKEIQEQARVNTCRSDNKKVIMAVNAPDACVLSNTSGQLLAAKHSTLITMFWLNLTKVAHVDHLQATEFASQLPVFMFV
jgi:hypothetical protein